MALLPEASSCPTHITSCLQGREVDRKATAILSAPCPFTSNQCRGAEIDGLNLENGLVSNLKIQAVQCNTWSWDSGV